VKFYELAIGAVFTVYGKTYTKTAMSMSADERNWGCIFLGGVEVESDGPLLPPEVAAKWKPDERQWPKEIEALFTSYPSGAHSQPGASPNQD
jgi:hypothetical protein